MADAQKIDCYMDLGWVNCISRGGAALFLGNLLRERPSVFVVGVYRKVPPSIPPGGMVFDP